MFIYTPIAKHDSASQTIYFRKGNGNYRRSDPERATFGEW